MGLTVSKWMFINLLFLSSLSCSVYSINVFSPAANISTLWINNGLDRKESFSFADGSLLRFVLFNNTDSSDSFPGMGCGFFSKETHNMFYFVVFAIKVHPTAAISTQNIPRVLWTANRNRPVGDNATLELTSKGNLVLKDVDNSFVWSTNTTGNSVVGMTINGSGNLILYNRYNDVIWQSFNYPTDSWLPGQQLKIHQRLVASVSASNWTTSPLYIVFDGASLNAFVQMNPPQSYAGVPYIYSSRKYTSFPTVTIENLGQTIEFHSDTNRELQYIRLDSDGHLRVYKFGDQVEEVVMNLMTTDECEYPTVCGRYGICSNRQCSCPMATTGDISYFRMLNSAKPSLGCVATTPLNCKKPQLHVLVELNAVDYFYRNDTTNTDESIQSCKQACLQQCSCKVAIYEERDVGTYCSLISDVFTLKSNGGGGNNYNISTFIKVQRQPSLAASPSPSPATEPNSPGNFSAKNSTDLQRILVGTSLVLLIVVTALGFVFFRSRRRNMEDLAENDVNEAGEDFFYQVSEMPRRFSFNELKSATGNFQKRLGGGGFGSVFEGSFDDGSRIAVKRLDQLGQGTKEFLAEVKTIGSIHHVNLVRLVGFCVENSNKLLVYEYMCNGSLDKWIFQQNQELALTWQTRRKIILDIAKGLSYLHEKCRKRIVHLDIKPQNILLDGEFNAKVSDFGLARFIERDESQVLTTMRGTRGYLAPEWLLNRRISEKVDVYSFGVVVLEIMCGRKNLEYSHLEIYECLLYLVKRKAEEDRLFDIVDKQSEDMLHHKEEAIKMIRTAICCLQGVSTRRPSMSMVVKVLEGGMELENITDYSFLTLTPMDLPREVDASNSAPLLPSTLSGPR